MLLAIIALLLLFLLVLAAAGLYFYRVAIARTEKAFLSANPDLVSGEAAESSLEDAGAWWNRQVFEEWSIRSEDGLRLHAYYLPAERQTDKTVILAHGYSGHAAAMSGLARMYSEALGFNVLLPDARGHGRSGGRYIGFGWRDRFDMAGWIGRILAHAGEGSQIVLHGVSMGGAAVMMASGEKLPPNVKAIIEDCGYTSVKDELAYQLRRMYRLPAFPMIPITSLVTKLRAGYFFGEASALEQVKKSKTPILFIHGGADLFVPTAMVYELYENGPAEKKLFVVPDAGHGLARQADPGGYDREVAAFIGTYVR